MSRSRPDEQERAVELAQTAASQVEASPALRERVELLQATASEPTRMRSARLAVIAGALVVAAARLRSAIRR